MPTLRSRAVIGAWTLLWLFTLDVAVNVLFAYPDDPRMIDPGRLQTYFEYGRSVEGKFRAMTRPTDAASAPILRAGWLERPGPRGEGPIARRSSDRLAITIYGMSHARRLALALHRTTDDVAIRSVTAPAATPNWSFAAYAREASGGEHILDGSPDEDPRAAGTFEQPDAVVFAILSATVPMINTLSNATAFFDQARPYTQPRYRLEGEELVTVEPLFLSLAGYRQALASPTRWLAYRRQLESFDPYYDPLLFRQSVLDGSSLVRVVRRGYAISARRKLAAGVYSSSGFVSDSEEVRVLLRLVTEFAQMARENGVVPVVYVANSLGYSDHLFQVLQPTLSSEGISSVSSHRFCSPSDPRCYLPDSHFLPATDDAMARELVRVIDAVLARAHR